MKYHLPLTRGHLEVNNPLRLLASAHVRKVTGSVVLSRHRCVKQIYLRDGEIVGATSNQPSESLGTLLLCNGIITSEAYTQSLLLMDRSDKRHGEILVAIGALAQEKLPEMLRLQHLTRLTDAIAWTRGLYEFRAGDPPKTNESFSMWLMFQTALYRRMGRERIVEHARQHRDCCVAMKRSVLEPLVDTVNEVSEIVGEVDGRLSVAQLGTRRSNQLLFYTNLLLLRELGILDFKRATVRKAA